MKRIILLLLVTIVATLVVPAQKKTFLRLYDLSGKKFTKGFFAGTTDTSVLLLKDNTIASVPINQIGIIRTKRTVGHTALVTAAITGAAFAIIFAAGSSDSDGFFTYTAGEGVATGLLVGGGGGAFLGAIFGSFKKSLLFQINGSPENWIKLKPVFDKMIVATISSGNQ